MKYLAIAFLVSVVVAPASEEILAFEVTSKGEATPRVLGADERVIPGSRVEVLLKRNAEFRETVTVHNVREAIRGEVIMAEVAHKFKWEWTGQIGVRNLPAATTTVVAVELDKHDKIKKDGQLRVFWPTDRDGVFQHLTSRSFCLVALKQGCILGIRKTKSWDIDQDWRTLPMHKLSQDLVLANLQSRRN